MKKKPWFIIGVTTLIMILAVVPGHELNAVVSWDEYSLQEVYDPGNNYYAYAPSVIRDGNVEHIWTCHNDVAGTIRDHIYYTKRVNGTIVESRSVLSAGEAGAWDQFHVCDPSVIGGEFHYDGETYQYAMFYLGNDVDASINNQIGVAFSNDLSGDWVKYPNPIVPFASNGRWGVGQPSATSVDGQGRLLLFYTKGDDITAGYRRELNLHDMSAPVVGPEMKLTDAGLTKRDGTPDYLNNFDIAYNPADDRFYAVREQHDYPTTNPTYIGESLQIVSIPGAAVWGGGGEWKVEGVINPALTGKSRNHNGGLVRSLYGTLIDPDAIKVVFADSCAGDECGGMLPLWSYSLWEFEGELIDDAEFLTIHFDDFSSRYITVDSLSPQLNTGTWELAGTAYELPNQRNKACDRSAPNSNIHARCSDEYYGSIWLGYAFYNDNGFLIEPGTAYRYDVSEEQQFNIEIKKPSGLEPNEAVTLEVYMLNDHGKKLDLVRQTFSFR